MSKDQSLDWYQITDEEMAICSQDLRELSYGFGLHFLVSFFVICKSTHLETISPWWCHLQNIQSHLPRRPSFSQHVLWQCCNPLGILSSMAGILLFNSIFHDGVTPVNVSTLKPPLGVIGVLPMKPQAFLILSVRI